MRFYGFCASAFTVGLLALGAGSRILAAAGTAETGLGPIEQAISVDLEYQETAFEALSVKALFAPGKAVEATPFKKEPPSSGGQVQRQFLRLGGSATNLMAFLWEPPSLLYLDLNRNLDLTDDPQGVFRLGGGQGKRAFNGIQVEAGGTRYCLDLRLFDQGEAIGGTASLRSFYQARMEIGGKPWQVGVVRNPFEASQHLGPRDLLVRPWDERARPFSLAKRMPEHWKFDRGIFLQDGTYQAAGIGASPDSPGKLRLDLTRRAPALGLLRLDGTNIHRLVMEGSGVPTVVLDDPPANVRVPLGTYLHHRVSLKRGATEATADYPQAVVVKSEAETVFRVGGPLTNSVSVQRRGNFLVLNYALVGSGGTPYQLAGDTRSVAPQFAIHQDGRRLATGKFEFG